MHRVVAGFVIRLRVDFSKAVADEPLWEAGSVRLALRLAGHAKGLEEYDVRCGNYLNFPMPDGSCPVVEATLCERGGRVGLPLGALAHPEGIHEVTLDFSPPHWSIHVDGLRDEDMPPTPDGIVSPPAEMRGTILSPRVMAVDPAPGNRQAAERAPDSRRIGRSIQYWTPDDPNAWVGDVALGLWRGRLHVFYLFDRRHHASGGGTGRHFFAHLSSANLADWDEHPPAVPIEEWWETLGTGTPFVFKGKFHLAYGLHTSRLTKDPSVPRGATYATSEDGIHFVRSRQIIHPTENPTIYNRADGRLGLAVGYSGTGGLWTSDHIGGWQPFDDTVPTRGDCPCPFEWNGHHYILQGFDGFAHSATGEPGTFEDWAKTGRAPYEGLSVPMVAPFGKNRRIMAGWLKPPRGWWGGWLVFRELVQEADGALGTKWVPEITPPTPPETFVARAGQPFRLAFGRKEGDGPPLILSIDPAARTVAFADDVPNPQFTRPDDARNVRIGNLPDFGGDYAVRVIRHWDSKADATVFDAEIGGVRTLVCCREGRFD